MKEDAKNLLDKDEIGYLMFSIDYIGGLQGRLENGLTMAEDKHSAPVISEFMKGLATALGYNQQNYRKISDERLRDNINNIVYRFKN